MRIDLQQQNCGCFEFKKIGISKYLDLPAFTLLFKNGIISSYLIILLERLGEMTFKLY